MKLDSASLDEETLEWLRSSIALSLVASGETAALHHQVLQDQSWPESELMLLQLAEGEAAAYILDDRESYESIVECVTRYGIHRLPRGLAIAPTSYLHQVATHLCRDLWAEAAIVAEQGAATDFEEADSRVDVALSKATLCCVLSRNSEAKQYVAQLEHLLVEKSVPRKRAAYLRTMTSLFSSFTRADWSAFSSALTTADNELARYLVKSSASVGSGGAGGPDASEFVDYSAAALSIAAERRGCKVPSTRMSDIVWLGRKD